MEIALYLPARTAISLQHPVLFVHEGRCCMKYALIDPFYNSHLPTTSSSICSRGWLLYGECTVLTLSITAISLQHRYIC